MSRINYEYCTLFKLFNLKKGPNDEVCKTNVLLTNQNILDDDDGENNIFTQILSGNDCRMQKLSKIYSNVPRSFEQIDNTVEIQMTVRHSVIK